MGNAIKTPSVNEVLDFIKDEINKWDSILVEVNKQRQSKAFDSYIYKSFNATEDRWRRLRNCMPSNQTQIPFIEEGMKYDFEKDFNRMNQTISSLKTENAHLKQRNQYLEKRHNENEIHISDLKMCVSELNQRNQDALGAKKTSEKKAKTNQEQTAIRECQQTIKRQEQQLIDKDNETQFLKETINSLKKQTALVEEERNEFQLRLSKLAGERLLDNNPSIADLSDPHRPTKLGECYSEIYDNEWTNALDALQLHGHEEDIAIETLQLTLLNIYEFCMNKAGMVLRQSTDAVNLLFEEYKEAVIVTVPAHLTVRVQNPRRRRTALHEIQLQQRWKPKNESIPFTKHSLSTAKELAGHKDKLKDKAESKLIQLRKEVAVSMVPIVQEAYIDASWDPKCLAELRPFIMKCLQIAWMMIVQSPPMFFKTCEADKSFQKDMFREYTKRGPVVDFMVWPALLLERMVQWLLKV